MSAMDHHSIEADGVVEGYVTGRLDPATLARFEEHYLDCPRCVAAIEEAEQLGAGLRQVAREDAGRGAPAAPTKRLRLPLLMAAAIAGMALALVALVASRRVATLEEQLAIARAPQANTPIINLAVLRSDHAEDAQRIRLAPRHEWWLVTVPVASQSFEGAPYQVTILHDDGETIWHTEDAVVDARGELVLSLHSSWLPPGRYRLRAVPGVVSGSPDAGEPISISLRVEPPSS